MRNLGCKLHVKAWSCLEYVMLGTRSSSEAFSTVLIANQDTASSLWVWEQWTNKENNGARVIKTYLHASS